MSCFEFQVDLQIVEVRNERTVDLLGALEGRGGGGKEHGGVLLATLFKCRLMKAHRKKSYLPRISRLLRPVRLERLLGRLGFHLPTFIRSLSVS